MNWRAGTALLAIAGGLPVETRGAVDTVHELDPYRVEANADADLKTRMELHSAGRLLIDPSSASRMGTWLSERDISGTAARQIEDLFWLVPGATEQARFGVITVPTLRGDAAESLLNGQRRGDNLFGIPPSFLAVESMEVVMGPPILSAGLGKRTGGSVNLTSKRPMPDAAFGTVDLRLGTWVPGGGSYQTGQVSLDFNQPIGERQALRVVLGLREDETFYQRNGGRDDLREAYLAWRWTGKSGAVVDWLASYQEVDRPQTLGVNRPWQGLIDDGLYVTGIPQDGLIDPGLLASAPDELVSLPRDRVLLSQGDTGEGEAILSQVIWNQPLAGEHHFVQSTLIEAIDREKRNQFYYAEAVEQLTIDSISKVTGQFETGEGSLDWEAGLHLRLEERDNRTNYWNEFAYAYDLTEGRHFNVFEEWPGFVAPGAVEDAAGHPWYVPSSPFSTPESTDSTVRQAGVFTELEHSLGSGWFIGVSGRIDWIDVEAMEPRDLVPENALRDKASFRATSGSIQLRKEWEQAHVYATVGSYRGIAGNTVGDGVNLYGTAGLNEADFKNRSELVEVGGRIDTGNGLGFRWAVFHQERRRVEFFGANDIKVRGLEAAVDWQVRDSTRLTVTGHYLDARYDHAAPAEFGGGSIWNVYAEGAGPTGEGNGLGYTAGFFANSLPPGDYRIPGLPRWQVNAGIEHLIMENLTFRVWGGWKGDYPGNLAGEYTIPSQTEWNASLDYTTGRWGFQLTARNLFDAENWIHNGDTFFNQLLVSRNLPLRLEGRVRIRF